MKKKIDENKNLNNDPSKHIKNIYDYGSPLKDQIIHLKTSSKIESSKMKKNEIINNNNLKQIFVLNDEKKNEIKNTIINNFSHQKDFVENAELNLISAPSKLLNKLVLDPNIVASSEENIEIPLPNKINTFFPNKNLISPGILINDKLLDIDNAKVSTEKNLNLNNEYIFSEGNKFDDEWHIRLINKKGDIVTKKANEKSYIVDLIKTGKLKIGNKLILSEQV